MADYGFEIRRADGSLALTSRETLPRLIHIQRFAGNFSGTFSVPDFDGVESGGIFTGRGFYYVQKVLVGTDAQTSVLPTLSWDNTTKIMTVTEPSLPSNWPPGQTKTPYEIIFMHFR